MKRFLAGCALFTLAACSFGEDQSMAPDYKLHGQLVNTREFGTVISVDQDAHVAVHNMGAATTTVAGNAAGAAAGNTLTAAAGGSIFSPLLSPFTSLMGGAGSAANTYSQAPSVGTETELHYVIRKDDGTVVNLDQVPEDGDAILYPGQRCMLQYNGQFTHLYPADVEHRRTFNNN